MTFNIAENPDKLIGVRMAGLTLLDLIDHNDYSAWYEGEEEAGDKRFIYVYTDREMRQKERNKIQGFRTIDDPIVQIEGNHLQLYIIIGNHRIVMPRRSREYLLATQTMPKYIGDYEVLGVLGRGYKGITFECRRKGVVRTTYALKLTIAQEYKDRSPGPEIDRMADLYRNDRDHFPSILDAGDWRQDELGQDFVYFVEEKLGGKTFDKFLLENDDQVTVSFIETFIREMLAALTTLQDLDLMHDDLHSGNIMIRDSHAGARIGIIDLGSSKNLGTSKKDRDDIRNLASHISQLLNIIEFRGEPKTGYEEYIIFGCKGLHALMSDDDPMRRPERARDLLGKFMDIIPKGSLRQELKHPFDFGNAEEVLDNDLLQKLSATSFPWKDKIESSSNLLVIGPRGCGKTTVFRSMSFTCLADAGKIEDAMSRAYIGLYISCNKEFRLRFSSIHDDTLKKRENEIRHYFNLLVLREFTKSLNAAKIANKMSAGDIERFCQFIRDNIFIDLSKNIKSESILDEIEGELVRLIGQARMSILGDKGMDNLTNQGFIEDLAMFSRERISAFTGKLLFLFVDDYTERKIPAEIQRALNHILFVPNSSYKSKLSSEVFGVLHDQSLGSFFDQDRDYKEINLGTFYIALPDQQKKDFIMEIVDTRLKLCGYEGRVQDIIGQSLYPDKNLARSLKCEFEKRAELREKRKTQLLDDGLDLQIEEELKTLQKKTYYHGWDTICDLCTGDISNILEILDRIYTECGIQKASRNLIPSPKQNSIIQKYSLQYLNKIKGIPLYGKNLFEIVDAFGNMSSRLFKEYPRIDRGVERQDPYQLIRIEMDEGYNKIAETSLKNYRQIYEKDQAGVDPDILWILLQRYSVFIDADESRSRRNTLSRKILLRRLFCPAFNISLTNSECFTLDKYKWGKFCSDPKGTADRYVKDVIEKKTSNGRPELVPTLPFDN